MRIAPRAETAANRTAGEALPGVRVGVVCSAARALMESKTYEQSTEPGAGGGGGGRK